MTTAIPEVASGANRRSARVGPILLLVLGSILGLLALASLAGGGFLAWANATQRDDSGYFTTSAHRFAAGGYALTQTDVDLDGWPSWPKPDGFATFRISATSADGKPVFVGVAPERAVDSYLARVAHSELTDVEYEPFSADYAVTAGGAPSTPPSRAGFWDGAVSGKGTQTLTWKPHSGTWAVVVMNADGSKGVRADVALGAKVAYLGWVAAGLLALGALILAGAGTMLLFGARGLGRS